MKRKKDNRRTKRERTLSKVMTIQAIFLLVLSFLIIVHYLPDNIDFSVNKNSTRVFSIQSLKLGSNIGYTEKGIIKEAQRYFDIEEEYDFIVAYTNENIMGSALFYMGEEVIYVGRIPHRLFSMVFTHEYAHRVHNKIGIQEYTTELDEALADTYMWFQYEDDAKRTWGERNQFREYPYTIIVNKLIEVDNLDCLNNVFKTDDKIGDIEEYVDRLQESCGIDKDALFEEAKVLWRMDK